MSVTNSLSENPNGDLGSAVSSGLETRAERILGRGTKPIPPGGQKASEGVRFAGALDSFERVVILALYSWLVVRILASWMVEKEIGTLVLLVSEGLVVVFVLIRRNTNVVSRRPQDWMFTFLGASTPLLVCPAAGRSLVPSLVAATLMIVGVLVQLHAKLVLGRSFGGVPANRGLQFSGPYRHVRHPMYLGYLLTHIAFILMNPTLWNLGVYVVCYAAQISRVLAEERLLEKDPRYAAYMRRVRYRLLPGVF
jgi:protein-S-isoprenylcysteine O-methyltransferase Ste14